MAEKNSSVAGKQVKRRMTLEEISVMSSNEVQLIYCSIKYQCSKQTKLEGKIKITSSAYTLEMKKRKHRDLMGHQ